MTREIAVLGINLGKSSCSLAGLDAERYWLDRYIQHGTRIAPGRDGFSI
jgi:hypothetical protein